MRLLPHWIGALEGKGRSRLVGWYFETLMIVGELITVEPLSIAVVKEIAFSFHVLIIRRSPTTQQHSRWWNSDDTTGFVNSKALRAT